MSSSAEEASDLSAVLGALVINLGTLTEEQVEGMHATGEYSKMDLLNLLSVRVEGRLPDPCLLLL